MTTTVSGTAIEDILTQGPVVDQLSGFLPDAAEPDDGFGAVDGSQGIFLSPTLGAVTPAESYSTSVAELLQLQETVTAYEDRMILIRRNADVTETLARKALGILANLQSSVAIGTDLQNLVLFHTLGVRQIQLTFNWRNWAGDGCTERVDAGLTHFGIELVHRMNELGIIVDVSHSGPQTTFDAIEASKVPILFSHTNCKAICDHPRNKTDDEIRALAEIGGVMGISSFNWFVSDNPISSIDDLLDHYDHAIGLVGPEHVGIGSDFELPGWPGTEPDDNWEAHREIYGATEWAKLRGRFPPYIPAVNDAQRYRTIGAGLLARGHSSDTVAKVLGQNMLRVYRKVLQD